MKRLIIIMALCTALITGCVKEMKTSVLCIDGLQYAHVMHSSTRTTSMVQIIGTDGLPRECKKDTF